MLLFFGESNAFALLERKNSWEVFRPPNRFFAGERYLERYSERDIWRDIWKDICGENSKHFIFLTGKKSKMLRFPAEKEVETGKGFDIC